MKILVTGASSGIGQATALHLAQKGHHVLIAARRKERLAEIAAESATVVGDFLIGELDISRKESIDAFVTTHKAWLEDLDVLVNNAGLALGREPFQNTSSEDLKTVLDTNVFGLLELSRQILPMMIKNGKGHIVNLGSVAGIWAYGGGAAYCASKAAVHIFTEALRQDLAGTPLRVSTIAPGRVATEFSVVRFKGDRDRAQKIYEGFEALSGQDIAETISWVIERPPHVNIQEIVMFSTEQPTATTVVPCKTKL